MEQTGCSEMSAHHIQKAMESPKKGIQDFLYSYKTSVLFSFTKSCPKKFFSTTLIIQPPSIYFETCQDEMYVYFKDFERKLKTAALLLHTHAQTHTHTHTHTISFLKNSV